MDATQDIQSNARHAIGDLNGILDRQVGYQQIWECVRSANVRIERIKELLTEAGFRTSE